MFTYLLFCCCCFIVLFSYYFLIKIHTLFFYFFFITLVYFILLRCLSKVYNVNTALFLIFLLFLITFFWSNIRVINFIYYNYEFLFLFNKFIY